MGSHVYTPFTVPASTWAPTPHLKISRSIILPALYVDTSDAKTGSFSYKLMLSRNHGYAHLYDTQWHYPLAMTILGQHRRRRL